MLESICLPRMKITIVSGIPDGDCKGEEWTEDSGKKVRPNQLLPFWLWKKKG